MNKVSSLLLYVLNNCNVIQYRKMEAVAGILVFTLYSLNSQRVDCGLEILIQWGFFSFIY